MKTKTLAATFVLAFTLPFAFSACSDDDDPAEPSPSPSASAEENLVSLTCPEPLGPVDVTTAEDQWAPGYVVGSDTILDPVAFGEITGKTSTGATFTEPAITKEGADTTDAIECSFTDTFKDTDENGDPVTGTLSGTVTVTVRK